MNRKREKILLGQLVLADAITNASLFEQITAKFGIWHYFPHQL